MASLTICGGGVRHESLADAQYVSELCWQLRYSTERYEALLRLSTRCTWVHAVQWYLHNIMHTLKIPVWSIGGRQPGCGTRRVRLDRARTELQLGRHLHADGILPCRCRLIHLRARGYKHMCPAVKPGECFTQHSVHASCYDYEIKAALELHPVSWEKTRDFEYSNTEY